MNTNFFYFLFLTVFLSSCQHETEFVSIDNFEIDNAQVMNLDKVSLIYSSETPSKEPVLSYFIHLVGVVERTNDTLNILTTFNRGGGNGTQKNQFVLYAFDSEDGKTYFDNLYNSEDSTAHSMEELNNIDRVVHDQRFDFITNNNYRTVTGFIDKE